MAKNNFDDLRSTLLNTFNFVAEKVLDLADAAADTAKAGHEIAKLLMEKKRAETALEETYAALGKLYYDLNKNTAGAVYEELCDEVTDLLETLENINDEIADLKDSMGSEFQDIEVEFNEFFEDGDFESVVNDTETEAETPADVHDPSAGITDKPEE